MTEQEEVEMQHNKLSIGKTVILTGSSQQIQLGECSNVPFYQQCTGTHQLINKCRIFCTTSLHTQPLHLFTHITTLQQEVARGRQTSRQVNKQVAGQR